MGTISGAITLVTWGNGNNYWRYKFNCDSTTITTAEIGVLDGVTPGTATASKALVLDSDKDIGTIRNLTIDGVFTDGNYFWYKW